MEQAAGARCDGDALTFRVPDPERRLAGVRLVQHAGLPRDRLHFTYDGTGDAGGTWLLTVARPAIRRLEYLLELRHGDGRTEVVCDPDNPSRVGGAFGDRSVVECAEYTEPAWLRLPTVDGYWRELAVPAPAVDGEVWARIWSPVTPTDRVLVAHDGPEYDKLAALGHYSAAMVAAGALPAHHLVLLAPGDRNEWYSASPAYTRALVAEVLPRLRAELGTGRRVVGMGASLGGLAMLHAQRRRPAAFAGLFLQSGSFFQPRFDPQESGFHRYPRIVRFTGGLLRAAASGGATGPAASGGSGGGRGGRNVAVPTALTCGTVEENLRNNQDMARALRALGYPAELAEVPDAHNYTGWRDAFDPYLTDLLRHVWAPRRPGT